MLRIAHELHERQRFPTREVERLLLGQQVVGVDRQLELQIADPAIAAHGIVGDHHIPRRDDHKERDFSHTKPLPLPLGEGRGEGCVSSQTVQ